MRLTGVSPNSGRQLDRPMTRPGRQSHADCAALPARPIALKSRRKRISSAGICHSHLPGFRSQGGIRSFHLGCSISFPRWERWYVDSEIPPVAIRTAVGVANTKMQGRNSNGGSAIPTFAPNPPVMMASQCSRQLSRDRWPVNMFSEYSRPAVASRSAIRFPHCRVTTRPAL